MAKLIGKGVRLDPAMVQVDDIADLGGGRFAVAGKSAGSSQEQETRIWWFDESGAQIGSFTTLVEAGDRLRQASDIAPGGSGLDVMSARMVSPQPFTGDNPVLLEKLSPGNGGAERQALDGAEVNSLVKPELEPWGGGYALVQARNGQSTSDWGIDLLRLDAGGTALFRREIDLDPDYPVSGATVTEIADDGLAVAATYDNTSRALWLWTLDGAGQVTSSQRVDRLGAASNVPRPDASDADIVALARGDILLGWDEGPLRARRFDADGNVLGEEFTIAEQGEDLRFHALEDGGFLATWMEIGFSDVLVRSTREIYVREFDATGHAVGRARMVTDLADASADPTLVGDGGDGATLIWYDQFWNGVGESRDYVAQAVIRGIRSEWSPGTVETGSAGRDKLSGTAADDLLSGAGRRDVLKGLGGDDDLRGGGGNDRLLGARGRDHLEGGSGNDVLLGARGNDVLAGGRGDDVLVGGGGKDRFLFREQTGADTIRDFNAQKDVIVLEGALFGGSSTAGRPSVTETGGDTIISYVRSDIAARIVLEGVVDLDYDINFLSGPILIY